MKEVTVTVLTITVLTKTVVTVTRNCICYKEL